MREGLHRLRRRYSLRSQRFFLDLWHCRAKAFSEAFAHVNMPMLRVDEGRMRIVLLSAPNVLLCRALFPWRDVAARLRRLRRIVALISTRGLLRAFSCLKYAVHAHKALVVAGVHKWHAWGQRCAEALAGRHGAWRMWAAAAMQATALRRVSARIQGRRRCMAALRAFSALRHGTHACRLTRIKVADALGRCVAVTQGHHDQCRAPSLCCHFCTRNVCTICTYDVYISSVGMICAIL